MNELIDHILHALRQHHALGDVVGLGRIARLTNYEMNAHDYEAAFVELTKMGYMERRPGAMWCILAFDRATTCAVCGKYAPKQCTDCKAIFCVECYEKHMQLSQRGEKHPSGCTCGECTHSRIEYQRDLDADGEP